MDKGIGCLIRELGVVDTEYFISFIKNDRFDYTQWRKIQFDDMSVNEINEAAARYEKEHQFAGNGRQI